MERTLTVSTLAPSLSMTSFPVITLLPQISAFSSSVSSEDVSLSTSFFQSQTLVVLPIGNIRDLPVVFTSIGSVLMRASELGGGGAGADILARGRDFLTTGVSDDEGGNGGGAGEDGGADFVLASPDLILGADDESGLAIGADDIKDLDAPGKEGLE